MHFRAKGARRRVYFPATYFLYSIARIALVSLPRSRFSIVTQRSQTCGEERCVTILKTAARETRIARTPSLIFVNITKDKSP